MGQQRPAQVDGIEVDDVGSVDGEVGHHHHEAADTRDQHA